MAASLFLKYCSHSLCELQFFCLLDTASSVCAQRSSFALAPNYWCFHAQVLKEFFFSDIVNYSCGCFPGWCSASQAFQHYKKKRYPQQQLFNLSQVQQCTYLVLMLLKLTFWAHQVLKSRFIMIVTTNAQLTKRVYPRLPDCLAFEYHRFAEPGKIHLQLIYLSNSSIDTYCGLKSG